MTTRAKLRESSPLPATLVTCVVERLAGVTTPSMLSNPGLLDVSLSSTP